MISLELISEFNLTAKETIASKSDPEMAYM